MRQISVGGPRKGGGEKGEGEVGGSVHKVTICVHFAKHAGALAPYEGFLRNIFRRFMKKKNSNSIPYKTIS